MDLFIFGFGAGWFLMGFLNLRANRTLRQQRDYALHKAGEFFEENNELVDLLGRVRRDYRRLRRDVEDGDGWKHR